MHLQTIAVDTCGAILLSVAIFKSVMAVVSTLKAPSPHNNASSD